MNRNALLIVGAVIVVVCAVVGARLLLRKRKHCPPVQVKELFVLDRTALPERPPSRFGSVRALTSNAVGVSPEIAFALAEITLQGNGFGFFNPFADFAEGKPLSDDLDDCIDRHCDAVWVKGRLQAVFKTPMASFEECGGEKCFHRQTLAALVQTSAGGYETIPFECSDSYGDTALMFSTVPPPPELRDRIARAFYMLLLNDQAELADYTDRMYHSGGGQWFAFGIRSGNPFIDEDWNELATHRRSAQGDLPPGSPGVDIADQELESIVTILRTGYADELGAAGVRSAAMPPKEIGASLHEWAIQEKPFKSVPYDMTDTGEKVENYARLLLKKDSAAGKRAVMFALTRLNWNVSTALEKAGDRSGLNEIHQRLNAKWRKSP